MPAAVFRNVALKSVSGFVKDVSKALLSSVGILVSVGDYNRKLRQRPVLDTSCDYYSSLDILGIGRRNDCCGPWRRS